MIFRFVLNGEYSAPPAARVAFSDRYVRDKSEQFPFTLTIGDSQEFFEAEFGDTSSYLKQVLFIDIYTNRGNFRYRPDRGFEKISEADERMRPALEQAYQANDAQKGQEEEQKRQDINKGFLDAMTKPRKSAQP